MQTARHCDSILTKISDYFKTFIKAPTPNIKFHEIPSSRNRTNTLGRTGGRFQRLIRTRLNTNKRREVTAAESNKRQKHEKQQKVKIIHFPLRITKKTNRIFSMCV